MTQGGCDGGGRRCGGDADGHHGAVEVRGLTKVFGVGDTRVEALRGVDLDVRAGEFLAVMGPSGSGKSTLLHLVGGLDRPTSGTVRVAGDDLSTMEDDALTLLRRRRIGFVFQFFNLLPILSAAENVSLPSDHRRGARVRGGPAGRGGHGVWWVWPTVQATAPASCRAASSSGWPSLGPW